MTHKMRQLYVILIESQTRATSLQVFKNIFTTLDEIFLHILHQNVFKPT